MKILSPSALIEMLPEATSWIAREETPVIVRCGNTWFYSQTLFVNGFEPQQIEDWLLSRFGYVKSLSSIALNEYSLRFRFPAKWHLHDEWSAKASDLVLAGREFARPGKYPAVWHIDRNSAHAACCCGLRLPAPYSLRYYTNPDAVRTARALRYDGICNARVVVERPSAVQGILPVREDSGIRYPNGIGEVFGGTWTMNEVRYALANGCQLLDMAWCLYGITRYLYLDGFARWCFAERKASEASGDKIGVAIWKMMVNRFIGRLGLEAGKSCEFVPDSKGNVLCAGRRWQQRPLRTKPLTNRIFAAYVFAEQRIALHRAMQSARGVAYAHTDSVVCEELPANIRIGSGLGEWKLFDREPQPYEVFARGVFQAAKRRAHRGRK